MMCYRRSSYKVCENWRAFPPRSRPKKDSEALPSFLPASLHSPTHERERCTWCIASRVGILGEIAGATVFLWICGIPTLFCTFYETASVAFSLSAKPSVHWRCVTCVTCKMPMVCKINGFRINQICGLSPILNGVEDQPYFRYAA